MMIECYIEHFKSDGYGGFTKRIRVSEDKFINNCEIKAVKNGGDDLSGVVSTNIDLLPISFKRIRKISRNIMFMALDCDTTESYVAAAHCLSNYNIKWTIIESSPGHYWIITNFVGDYRTVLNMMQKIVGVDRQYIDMCMREKQCFIRSVPTPNRVPCLDNTNIDILEDDRIAQWITEYSNLLSRQSNVLANAICAKALKNDNIYELAVDPKFL